MTDPLKLDELLNLEILPDWTKSSPSEDTARYSDAEGEAAHSPRGSARPRREGFAPGGRPANRGGGARDSFSRNRPGGAGGGDRSRHERDRGTRREGSGKPKNPRFARGESSREEAPAPVAPPVTLPDVEISFLPIEGGIATVGRQIKGSFKAFPVFDIARLFLDKPERQNVKFQTKAAEQSLYQDSVTGLLFTKQSDLVAQILKSRMEEYYTVQKIQTEGPKGNFTGVAKCKLGGELLGPPNHHAYQTRLKELYLGKYSKRMSFDQFRMRIDIVKDEESLNQWKELESWKIEYLPKGSGDDAPRLNSLEEVEKHFKENILPGLSKTGRDFTISGTAARKLTDAGLRQAAFQSWESEVKFPIKFVNEVRPALVHAGLHIFKNRKNVTVVNSAKPKFFDIDLSTVSSNVAHIIEAVRTQPGIKLKALVQLVPFTPPEKNLALAESATVYFDPFEGIRPNPFLAATATAYFVPQKPSPRQAKALQSYHANAVLADLLWLVHEGYIIEFFDGSLEIGKKNPPQQPPPEKKGSAASTPATPPAEAPAPVSQGNSPVENIPPSPDSSSLPEQIAPVPVSENQIRELTAHTEPGEQKLS